MEQNNPDSRIPEVEKVKSADIVKNIFSLRSDFLIIGLTGRTGSGCTTVANILSEETFDSLSGKYKVKDSGIINNDFRKNRIVFNYIKENWMPFTVIRMSDLIYYYALQNSLDKIVESITTEYFNSKGDTKSKSSTSQSKKDKFTQDIHELLKDMQDQFQIFKNEILQIDSYIKHKDYQKETDEQKTKDLIGKYLEFILIKLPEFRKEIEKRLSEKERGLVPAVLQNWGDNIRRYKGIIPGAEKEDAPEALASIANKIIKMLRHYNRLYEKVDVGFKPTRIVIDALRNPFEILYFRERLSGFYCLSVNTTKQIRHDKLMKYRNLSYDEVNAIDEKEKSKSKEEESFRRIDIDRCLQLSDIHLSHSGEPVNNNFKLINQLFTYLSLMLHPGLVPPSPQERIMQIAYTAKMNSGCLSRQVGAAITDENYSIRAIGWNSTPEGQVPCALRVFENLTERMDQDAFSEYERTNPEFQANGIGKLSCAYKSRQEDINKSLRGLPIRYCFKDIHTTITEKQKYNQVHTRSLHAEENAFLQLAKYGGNGIKGGKLFSTASCCELCAKKAFHLGIKEIYYIDSYPGISLEHIFMGGASGTGPKVILFSGAVGRAYINLYNPFMPFKDELEALTEVNVKDTLTKGNNENQKSGKPINNPANGSNS